MLKSVLDVKKQLQINVQNAKKPGTVEGKKKINHNKLKKINVISKDTLIFQRMSS